MKTQLWKMKGLLFPRFFNQNRAIDTQVSTLKSNKSYGKSAHLWVDCPVLIKKKRGKT